MDPSQELGKLLDPWAAKLATGEIEGPFGRADVSAGELKRFVGTLQRSWQGVVGPQPRFLTAVLPPVRRSVVWPAEPSKPWPGQTAGQAVTPGQPGQASRRSTAGAGRARGIVGGTTPADHSSVGPSPTPSRAGEAGRRHLRRAAGGRRGHAALAAGLRGPGHRRPGHPRAPGGPTLRLVEEADDQAWTGQVHLPREAITDTTT